MDYFASAFVIAAFTVLMHLWVHAPLEATQMPHAPAPIVTVADAGN